PEIYPLSLHDALPIFHNTEGYPSAFSGGTWAMASPSVLEDLQKFGFNMFSWANNHTMDYSHGGLIATKKNLDEQNLTHAGVGEKDRKSTRLNSSHGSI